MIAEAETVIADDPNNAVAHAQIGFSKMFLGHAEDGFADVETAHGPILFAFSNLQTAWKRFV